MPPSAYIPSLDGLRAVSILIVLLSHAGVSQRIPGGFGVTIFFFLSGFLITTLLLREYDRNGTVSLRNFYIRRLLRLTPPLLLTLLAAAVLYMLGFVRGALDPATLLSQIFFFTTTSPFTEMHSRSTGSVCCGRFPLRSISTSSGRRSSCC